MVREPIVAGQFYSADASSLKKELSGFIPNIKNKVNAIGIVSPHAGYAYSGKVAGEVLASTKPKKTYVIIGPNHTGMGKPFGVDTRSAWKTPLGEIKLNSRLTDAILSRSKYIKEDFSSHDYEHSIEVQLPFLQRLSPEFTFVPICVATGPREIYYKIASDIAESIKELDMDAAIIASSDMTHYEEHDSAKKKDMMAIDKILSLDIDGFLDTIEKYGITACGFVPISIMLKTSSLLGGKKAKLVSYSTSGDISGDYSSVVGYAGIIIY